MQVLITGVAGFVGGHMVDFLRHQHPEATIVGLDNHPGARARALGIEIVQADLEDAASVRAAFARLRPDRVIHLAAQSSPQRSWEDPAGTLRTSSSASSARGVSSRWAVRCACSTWRARSISSWRFSRSRSCWSFSEKYCTRSVSLSGCARKKAR